MAAAPERTGYDFIGDVHGEAERLKALLAALGYAGSADGGHFAHPDGRCAVFLGDLVDVGPAVREVVMLVRSMEAGGAALVLGGNHEVDLLRYHAAQGSNCGYLDYPERWESSKFAATLAAYADRPGEWVELLEWLRRLRVWIAGPGFRAVHACWDEGAIERLERWGRQRIGVFGHYDSGVLRLANGPKLKLPAPHTSFEVNGRKRSRIRTRWYLDPKGLRLAEAAFPMKAQVPVLPKATLTKEAREAFFPVGASEAPVFFGHYAWPEHPRPLAPNIACLDFGVSHGGLLGAYRWDGEQILEPGKFLAV